MLSFVKRFVLSLFVCTVCVFGGAYSALAACTNDQIDVNGDGNTCEDVKFTVTTTSAVTTEFKFRMTAKGAFYVDCGDDGSLSGTGASGKTISRSDTSTETYTCTYSTGGVKTLKFGGRATGYHTGTGNSDAPARSTISFRISTGKNDADTNSPLVGAISGKIGAVFPTLGTANGQQPQFYGTFKQAANLTSIPGDFFDGVYGSRDSMFRETFDSTGITEIPYGLFKDASGGAANMFRSTFGKCTHLASIQEDLFAGITSAAAYMFAYVFNGCTGFTNQYIPASAFKGLVAAGHPTASNLWSGSFGEGNTLLTTCPSETTTQFDTGYESSWNSKKSCMLKAIPVTLDMTEATTPGSPTTVYLKYNDGWYSDSALTTPITQMTTLPQKSGAAFVGYFDGMNQIVETNGDFVTTESVLKFTTYPKTLSAHFSEAVSNTVTYNCGTGTGTPPASASAIENVPFTPAGPGGCEKSGYAFAGWAVSGTNDIVASTFTWGYDSDKTLTAQWTESEFSVTTESLNSGDIFQFTMTAIGTFYVNCGIDGILTSTANDVSGNGQITRTGTGETTYSCTYSTGGVKTISFSGTATGYSTEDQVYGGSPAPYLKVAAIKFTSAALITEINGNLPSIFPYMPGEAADGAQPRFTETFKDAQITSIPATLFNGYTTGVNGMFTHTFSGCTQLTNAGLPATLFSTLTTGAKSMFFSTFKGTTSLTTVPATLFSTMAVTADMENMFDDTFYNSGLTTVPANLFNHITVGASNLFRHTFRGAAITSIPNNLFSHVTTGATDLFNGTFENCASLSAIPSGLFDSITTNISTGMFKSTFKGCTTITSIPSGLFDNVTVGLDNLFMETFSGDTHLTTIPGDLFENITNGAVDMFNSTFKGCTALATIPSGLFTNISQTTNSNARMFQSAFEGCTNLTTIPGNLFSGITVGGGNTFNATFKGCTALTTIPSGLFGNVTTGGDQMFIDVFNGCNHLTTIPSGLFGNLVTGSKNMFQRSFQGCTALAALPSGMFAKLTTGGESMFVDTFKNDTSLASLPDDLFGSLRTPAASLFQTTFDGCTSLSGYIKPSMFGELIKNGSPTALNMWKNTFNNTQMATSCPVNTTQYATGYNGTDTLAYTKWNGYVACVSTTPMEIALDTTGATTSGSPATVYLSYNTGWFSDSNGTNAITGLTAVPTKTGLVFAGFFTGQNGTGTQVVNASGQFVTNTVSYDTTTLYAYFGSATYTVTYACGDGATGTAPTATGAADGAMFVPADAGGCEKSGYVFSGWAVSGTNDVKNSPFTWNYNENKTFTAVWSDSGFSITTTNISDGGVFKFQISAIGTFTVDCGENGVLSGSGSGSTISGNTITRTGTSMGTYTCTYSTGGTKTINFGGKAIWYHASDAAIRFKYNSDLTETKIASVTGNMSAVFPYITANAQDGAQPRFKNTFQNATSLTSIGGNLFSNYTSGASYMFQNTFNGCTSLATIPVGLFTNITTGAPYMFQSTFNGCTTLTTIPSNLFKNITNGASYMFSKTFQGCTALTTVPDGLFENITNGASYMFDYVFQGCTSLSAMPERLFAGLTTGGDHMFNYAFAADTSMTGYIPPSTFAGLVETGAAIGTNTWNTIFYNGNTLATSCPDGTTQYFTGYEGVPYQTTWTNKKSCISTNPMTIALDTTGATTSGSPSTAYLVYNTGWYSDSNATNSITRLTTLPTKTGQSFFGFYTKPNGQGDLIINSQGYFVGNRVLYDADTIYAHFGTGYTVTYSCGTGTTGTAPANDTAVVDQPFFTPGRNTCAKDGYIFAGWDVSGTNDIKLADESFTWEYTGDKTFTAHWEPMKFSIGTTNLNANDVFKFQMNAIGEFYVDCGEGGTLTSDVNPTDVTANVKITRTSTTKQDTYTCTYATAGTKTIRFGGVATAYNTSATTPSIRFRNGSNLTETEIASVTGNMSAMFPYITENAQDGAQPRFYQTFYGATNLTSIDGTLFSGYTIGATNMFSNTFNGCTSLATIPDGLFENITTGATSMFESTFSGCTALTTIPDGLFENITTGATRMFVNTFLGCTALTALPERLFAGITNAETYMFMRTFMNCSSMSGYIPPSTFAGLIANGSPTAEHLWTESAYRIFYGTSLLTTCPTGTTQYFTGYEGDYWSNKVSCISTNPMTIALDTTGATTSGSPSTAYLVYNTGWYTDSNATTEITRLATLPTKTGQSFVGFYTKPNGEGTQVVNGQGYFINNRVLYDATALYAHFGTGYTVTYSCGDGTGTPPAVDNAVVGQSFTPANKNTCAKNGYTFSGWAVSGTDDVKYSGNTFTWEYESNKTFTARWFNSTFAVNTTNIAANGTFTFKMSAIGTFDVSCGDDGVLTSSANDVSGTTITRSDTTEATYTCTYSTAGTHTIAFNGVATGYSTDTSATGTAIKFSENTAVASVMGSLGAVFPTLGTNSGQQPIFYETFKNCSNLTTIPAELFSGVTGGSRNMFYNTFVGCSSLTAIPVGLFDDIDESADNMFFSTFSGCSTLTSIPDHLFDNITTGAGSLFRTTFENCTSLTSIPPELFANVTTGGTNMFLDTFNGCSSLSGYISPKLFAGLIANQQTFQSASIFGGTSLRTSCPTGMHQYITGYESSWNSKVSCVCDGAQYFDDYMCVACPTGYNSIANPDKISINQCQIECAGGTYLATANDTSCSNVGAGYYTLANITYYGDTGIRNECPAGTYSNATNATECTGCPIGTYASTTGGTSVSSCTACTGATYGNETGLAACKPCPAGYDYNTTSGKTSANQCQKHCDAGTWPAKSLEGYEILQYIETTGSQYIDTGLDVTSLTNPIVSLTMQYTAVENGKQNGQQTTGKMFKLGISLGGQFMIQTGGDGTEVDFGAADTNIHTFIINAENNTGALDNIVSPLVIGDYAINNTFFLGTIHQAAGPSSAKYNKARYYAFSVTSNGTPVMQLIPVRQESDDAVGMYDIVSKTFYPKASSNDLVAGQPGTSAAVLDLGFSTSNCVSVGAGYWIAANNTNYGSEATRNACPIGTYNDISNGTSAAACKSCAGATYNDETAASVCKICPTGYDYNTTSGKSASSQCQIHCDAGTYLASLPSGYTRLEYIKSTGTQYINTGITPSTLTNPIMSLTAQYTELPPDSTAWATGVKTSSKLFSVGIGSDGNFKILAGTGDHFATFGAADTNKHTFISNTANGTATLDNTSYALTVDDLSEIDIPIYVGARNGSDSVSKVKYYDFSLTSNGREVMHLIPARRNNDNVLGMYDIVTGTFFTNAGSGTFVTGPDSFDNACIAVPAGYYAAASTTNYGSSNNVLSACPTGYGLSDSGAGAQTDCYAMCTANEVPHATAFSGGNYYGGTNTCVPADSSSCETGYSYVATSGNVLAHCDNGTTITINWGDANGGIYESTSCEYGGTITTPATAPTKRGYTFVGWVIASPQNSPEV